ncbi:MAG: TIR domain-containing protein [Staphylococcus equorum]|nr:TIR domain-containing protein [Staphylococcus equorum]
MTDNLFVSYRADDEGNQYKNLLVAWANNPNKTFYDVKFYDTSVGIAINSKDADYIKKVIKERINSSKKVLVLVGENTSRSEWVEWEIEKAHALGKQLVAVKINNSYTSPDAIFGKNAKWAKSFTYESIKKALED